MIRLLSLLIICGLTCRSAIAFSPSLAKPRTLAVASRRPAVQRRQSRHVLLFMGWGPDPEWKSATIKTNEKACESGRSVLLTIEVSPETAAEYTIPGQYVQMRLNKDTKPLFMAVASPPDKENAVFEFLVKETSGNEWLMSLAANTPLEVSQIMGGGYALLENLDGFKYDFPTQNILLLAAGSGLAPLRSALLSGQLQVGGGGSGSSSSGSSSSGRTARLYYGERTAQDLCFVDQYGMWEKQLGVEVVPVLSQPDPAWQGRSGYVQTALEEDGIAIPRNSGALICGMKGMADSCKTLLMEAGVFEGRILFNF